MVKRACRALSGCDPCGEGIHQPPWAAAYQVSGEYAQIHAAAKLGWLDYQRARDEALLAIRRAGADIILYLLCQRGRGRQCRVPFGNNIMHLLQIY